jgi:hypothetical protein
VRVGEKKRPYNAFGQKPEEQRDYLAATLLNGNSVATLPRGASKLFLTESKNNKKEKRKNQTRTHENGN